MYVALTFFGIFTLQSYCIRLLKLMCISLAFVVGVTKLDFVGIGMLEFFVCRRTHHNQLKCNVIVSFCCVIVCNFLITPFSLVNSSCTINILIYLFWPWFSSRKYHRHGIRFYCFLQNIFWFTSFSIHCLLELIYRSFHNDSTVSYCFIAV